MASSKAKLPGYILSVDPGKLTGMALVDCTGDVPRLHWSIEVDEAGFAAPVRGVLEWAKAWDQTLSIVCERFTITAATAKKSQAPFSLEMIGVLKQCMRDAGRDPDTELIMQSPADAKRLCSNAQLKAVDLWHRGGEGHALDALRHVVLAVLASGYKDRRLLSTVGVDSED